MPSPLQIIKEQHGSKADLIAKIVPLIEAEEGESADDHKARLAHVANRKLLHLHALGEKVKGLGGRKAIQTKILELKKQPKDHEYETKLGTMSLGQIVDLLEALQYRARNPKKGHKK